jgi:IclR family transcriptional regulator, pca regulon regulatory protein
MSEPLEGTMPRKASAPSYRLGADGELLQSIPTLRDPRYSQSLERGLAILGCFTSERRMRGIADIAEELGMSRATTHRYASTLVALGYLEQGSSPKYQLGLRIADLGMAALGATGLREHSWTYLEELRRETSLTASLAVLDGPDVLLVDHARGFRRGQFRISPELASGSRLPVYCTALGKLLMAHLPPNELDRAVSQLRIIKCGPKTITSKTKLRVELEHVLQEGLAVSDEEFATGLISLAAPVRKGSGEVCAALGVAAHTSMISVEELLQRFVSSITAIAARLSAQLGEEDFSAQ